MPILELKQEYNTTLMRMYKAIDYMDGKVSSENKDKWLPEFKRLHEKLSELMAEIKATGYKMTDDEIRGGFQNG